MNRQTRFFCNIFLSDKLRLLWFLKAVSAYFHDIVEVKSVRKPRFWNVIAVSKSLACLIRFFGGPWLCSSLVSFCVVISWSRPLHYLTALLHGVFLCCCFFFLNYCLNYELHRYLMWLIFFLFRSLVHADELFTIYIELYAIARLIIFQHSIFGRYF